MKFISKSFLLSIILLCLVFSSSLSMLFRKNNASEVEVANKPKYPKTGCCHVKYLNGKKSEHGLTRFKTLHPFDNCKSSKDATRKKVNLSDAACKEHKDYYTKLIKKH